MRFNQIQRQFHLMVGLFLLLASPRIAYGQSAMAVFERVKDSVFVVKALDAKGAQISLGSAVQLPDGRFATNRHVVEKGSSFLVGRGEKFQPATVYAVDGDKDIALLEAPGVVGKPVQLGKASALKVGQPVYAVGAPQGLELSLSDGIVSQLRGGPPPFIQTTAAISPGSSGGGLFDSEGRLVGLTTLYIEGGQNLNFALPVEWIAVVRPGVTSVKDRSQGAWLARAAELERKKDWAGLRVWGLAWTKSEPTDSTAWSCLGEAYGFLDNYPEAIDAYQRALRIKPEDAGAWYDLGVCYGQLKRYDDAINALRQALRIDPDLAAAWYNLGMAYFDLERYSDAITPYLQALRINREYTKAWINLGNAYYFLGRSAEAVDAYHKALRINPENAYVWFVLGLAYSGLQRYTDAAYAFHQSVRIKPDDAWAWYFLGGAYHLAGNDDAARDVVKTLRRLDPEKADKLVDLIVSP